MKSLSSAKEYVRRLAMLTVGAFVYASGIALFLDPGNLVSGGVSGIGIILNRFIPFDTGLWVLALNIPLLIIGLIVFGRGFFISTVYSTVVSSLFITLLATKLGPYLPLSDDYLFNAMLGNVVMDAGVAILFREGGTSGGSDIIAKLLRRRMRYLSTGRIFMFLDGSVVALSALVFRNPVPALYSMAGLVVGNIVFDKIVYGFDEAKLLFVISAQQEKIKKRLLGELEIGVTLLPTFGGYTGAEQTVLMVAAKKALYPKIKDIVREEDKRAFMIVASANEVFGEGFKEASQNKEL